MAAEDRWVRASQEAAPKGGGDLHRHLPRKESSFRMEGVERKLKTLQLLESEKSGVKMSKRSSSSLFNKKPHDVGKLMSNSQLWWIPL